MADKTTGLFVTQAVLAAQDTYLMQTSEVAPISRVDGNDPRELRSLSLGYFAGAGEARSYARAYYYALLAEAAGDIAATSLREEIEARFGARGPDVAQVWNGIAAQMQQRAITDWIAADLPARYLKDN